jgi:hypothetical protein
MTSASSTISLDLSRYYQDRADTIVQLVQPLSLEQIWDRPYSYGNSIGHLFLHLTGNLNYYIGAEIAGTGYVRNRPLEFSDPVRHPREELLKNFTDALPWFGQLWLFSLKQTGLRRTRQEEWNTPATAFICFSPAQPIFHITPARSSICVSSSVLKMAVLLSPGFPHNRVPCAALEYTRREFAQSASFCLIAALSA